MSSYTYVALTDYSPVTLLVSSYTHIALTDYSPVTLLVCTTLTAESLQKDHDGDDPSIFHSTPLQNKRRYLKGTCCTFLLVLPGQNRTVSGLQMKWGRGGGHFAARWKAMEAFVPAKIQRPSILHLTRSVFVPATLYTQRAVSCEVSFVPLVLSLVRLALYLWYCLLWG